MQQEANGLKWMYGQVAVAAADDTDSDGAALDMQRRTVMCERLADRGRGKLSFRNGHVRQPRGWR